MWQKQKAIVYKRPNFSHYVPPIMEIQQVQQDKSLGVLLVSMLSACTHTDSIIATMNEHLHLPNQLRSQGLGITGLFMAFLVARFQ